MTTATVNEITRAQHEDALCEWREAYDVAWISGASRAEAIAHADKCAALVLGVKPEQVAYIIPEA